MGKKLLILLLFLISTTALAGDPHHTGSIIINNSVYVAEQQNEFNSGMATNNAFSGQNFDRGTLGLQWGCSYGYYDGTGAYVCGIGKRFGGKNSLLLNGSTSIGEGKPSFNLGIGGTF